MITLVGKIYNYANLKIISLVNFEKDAPTKSRKEERMEELYELEKESEFWPHDKKYIIVESKPKSKNQIINTKKRY